MQDRDRSPERGSPRGTWNIEWTNEWFPGHFRQGSWKNAYRFSRDGQVVEIRVSNYWKYQTTFIVDAEDFEKVKGITWYIIPNKKRTYWQIIHNHHGRTEPRLRTFPKNVVIARYLKNYTGPLEIDHKNRDTLDERQSNLRIATRKDQTNNRSLQRNSKTGENGITPKKQSFQWAVNYYKPNGRRTTKGFPRNPQDDQLPESFFEWERGMRDSGYERNLNPFPKTLSAHYRFTWRENNGYISKKFDFTEEGLADARRFRDEVVYPRIRNYNGAEYPNN